jgi:hypothetical protein
MVSGDESFGRNQRMKQRGVDRAENSHFLRGAEKSDGPGNRFEPAAVKVRITPIAVPAGDRQHEIETSVVGEPRQR